MQRRHFLSAAAALPLAASGVQLMAATKGTPRVLVVFLRGAYDAASLLVPVSSSFYYEQRPNIAIARPGSAADAAIPLNAEWGLNPALVDWAYAVTRDIKLPDDPALARGRAPYNGPGAQPPFVLEGDGLTSARFWYGPRMTEWAERWVPYWTGGKGVFAMSAEEDTGIMRALTLLAQDAHGIRLLQEQGIGQVQEGRPRTAGRVGFDEIDAVEFSRGLNAIRKRAMERIALIGRDKRQFPWVAEFLGQAGQRRALVDAAGGGHIGSIPDIHRRLRRDHDDGLLNNLRCAGRDNSGWGDGGSR